MTRIRVDNVEATLRGLKWTCSDPHWLRYLERYTRDVEMTGSTPDVEDLVLDHLRKTIDFEVLERRRPMPPPSNTAY